MIHIKKVMCLCCVFYTVTAHVSPAFAAFEYLGLGWPAATANIRVLGHHPDRYALNPALMTETFRPHLTLSYQHPYESLDLQAGAMSVMSRIGQRSYIHHVEYFGDDLYSEMKVSTGAFWTLRGAFKVGVSMNYHRLALAGFSNQQALTMSFSSYAEITDQFKLGSVVEHVIQIEDKLSIPQKFHMGGLYRTGIVDILLAIEKESALPLEACLGVVVSPQSFWQIALGYRDVSGMISAGWRVRSSRMAFHYVCVIHPNLPTSNGIGMELILP